MSTRTIHAADEDLVRRLDGELSTARCEALDAHLAQCDACRTRLADLVDVSLTLRDDAASETHALGAARARLARAMRHDAGQPEARSRAGRLLSRAMPHSGWRTLPWAAGAAAVLALAVWLGAPGMRTTRDAALTPNPQTRPIVALTPGATWDVSRAQVCGLDAPEVAVIAEHVRDEVVTAYGMAGVPQTEYELDYLITPELGGAPDARNLWPQRYDVPGWNARVKDQLEELLPALVCAGKVDLATAQHEIATDWIAAYRKYFRSDVPLPPSASDARDDDAPAFAVLDAPYRLATVPRARVIVLNVRATAPKTVRVAPGSTRQRT